MPYAARVALMFLSMYGASLSGCRGLDLELLHDRRPHHAEQDRGEHQQRRARRAGSSQVRRKTLAKNSTAQISAMNIRMFFDGSTAWSRGVGHAR